MRLNQLGLAFALIATAAAAIPAFAVGALGPDLQASLAVGPSLIGVTLTIFFATVAVTSPLAGAMAQRLRSHAWLALPMAGSGVVLVLLPALYRSVWGVALSGVLGGLAAASSQSIANVMLSSFAGRSRQGLLFGVKQSAVPVAGTLVGLVVARYTFRTGVGSVFLSLGLGCVALASLWIALIWYSGRRAGGRSSVPRIPHRGAVPAVGEADGLRETTPLTRLLVAGAFAGAAGMALAGFVVDGAVATGWSPNSAALLLSAGTAGSVVGRVLGGMVVDSGRMRSAVVVEVMMYGGAAGMLILVFMGGAAPAFAVGAMLGFTAGWGWSGAALFVVAKRNTGRVGLATGSLQGGIAVGAIVGPIGYAAAVSVQGHQLAWLSSAVSFAIAGWLVRTWSQKDGVRT